jgi:peroxiredoxin
MPYPKIILTTLFASLLFLTTALAAGSQGSGLSKLKNNPTAPNFVLPDKSGKLYSLADYKGKVVVINFWASWCPPCVAEMPSLQSAADELAKHDIPLLGIGVGESRDSVLRFLDKMPLRFPLLLDSKTEVMQRWSVPSLPTTIVVDAKGKIVLLALGEREWDSPEILQQIISVKKAP